MISRRQVIEGGALAALVAALPFSGLRKARAATATPTAFNFYVSPTGDDNNAGTLQSPWSITAINNNQSQYAGKVVGFLPGTYQYGTKGGVQTTLYSLIQNNAHSPGEALSCQGGSSSSSPTYFCACDSSGQYSPRTAIIDCSNPQSGSAPTATSQSVGVFGQVYGHPAPNVSQYGNLTIDGLVIRNWTFAAVFLQGDASLGYYPNNVIVQNCEIYNTSANIEGNNNPGAIFSQFSGGNDPSAGLSVINCLIHDLASTNPSGGGLLGVITMNGSFGTTITNCTFYNCDAVSSKDGWQSTNVSYCYMGFLGALGAAYYSGSDQASTPPGNVQNFLAGTGMTSTFHHNIVCGPMFSYGESANQSNLGTVQFYNNTFYKPANVGGSNLGLQMWTDYSDVSGGAGPFGVFQFWNNLVYAADGNYDSSASPGAFWKSGAATGGTFGTLSTNYNAYGSGMTFAQDYSTRYSLSQWKALGQGYDANSVSLTASPFSGTPQDPQTAASPSYGTFAVSSSSAAYTAGKGGAICGAVDGSGAVGCNFTTVASNQAQGLEPKPPVLGSVT